MASSALRARHPILLITAASCCRHAKWRRRASHPDLLLELKPGKASSAGGAGNGDARCRSSCCSAEETPATRGDTGALSGRLAAAQLEQATQAWLRSLRAGQVGAARPISGASCRRAGGAFLKFDRASEKRHEIMSTPAIITVAITGSQPSKAQNPAVPSTACRADRKHPRSVRGGREPRPYPCARRSGLVLHRYRDVPPGAGRHQDSTAPA